eukprot:2795843-Alexandrium_andersonii.AAC.1
MPNLPMKQPGARAGGASWEGGWLKGGGGWEDRHKGISIMKGAEHDGNRTGPNGHLPGYG